MVEALKKLEVFLKRDCTKHVAEFTHIQEKMFQLLFITHLNRVRVRRMN